MSNIFSFGRNQVAVLITVIVLIVAGAFYFLLYIPQHEETVQERRFRCLRKIDWRVHQKITTAQYLIANLLERYYDSEVSRGSKDDATLNKYIQGYSKKDFSLMLPKDATDYFEKHHQNLFESSRDTLGNIYYISYDVKLTLLVRKALRTATKNPKDSITIGMEYDLDQFIKPLVLSDIFDGYIIFINKEKVYETIPYGFNYDKSDSLFHMRNNISTPGVQTLRIGETEFKAFSHPVYTATKYKWIITGLVKSDNYNQEKNQLPVEVILFLLTAALAMLVALPWIKLYHMGNKDRLTLNDGMASILIAMVLMSFLFFVFFKYYVVLNPVPLPYSATDTSKRNYPADVYSRKVLASKISAAFTAEIQDANKLLDSINYERGQEEYTGDKNCLGYNYGRFDEVYETNKKALDIKQIYWIGANGMETVNFTVDQVNDPKAFYGNRAYFINPQGYTFGKFLYYLDQVFSYSHADFRSVIAQKSIKDSVIAMTFNMKSLSKVVMPFGFQFAVIDKLGKVLYDSKPNRNLMDRLISEFTNRKDLANYMEAGADATFKTDYYGRHYNVSIRPVPNLPYFTVILENSALNDIRDTEAYSFTLFMLTGMLVFLVIKYFTIFFISSRSTFLKRQRFDTSWIGPHRSSHHEYALSVIANLAVTALLLIYFSLSSLLEYVYMLMVSVVFTSMFTNLIFALRYKGTDMLKFRFKRNVIIWLSVFVALVNLSAGFYLDHWWHLLVYELILAAICTAIIFLTPFLTSKLSLLKKIPKGRWVFPGSYALMATTRLVISSGIPVAFFFVYSYNYEQRLDTRYRQMKFGQALIASPIIKGKKMETQNTYLDAHQKEGAYDAGFYTDGLYIDSIRVIDSAEAERAKEIVSCYSDEDKNTASLFRAVRLRMDSVAVLNNNINLESAGDSVFFDKLNKKTSDSTSVRTFIKLDGGNYLAISSLPGMNYHNPCIHFWLALLLALVASFIVIYRILRRLFSLDLPSTDSWGKLDDVLFENNSFNKKALIIGSPGANTLEKLVFKINKKKIRSAKGDALIFSQKPSYNSVFIADMIKINTENGDADPDWIKLKKHALAGHALVVINHFEYHVLDPRANRMKLDLLECLIEGAESKIIVISTMHPVIFLDSLDQQPNPDFDSEKGKWYTLLGNFHVVIDPLIAGSIPDGIEMPEKSIAEETHYSRFLHDLQRPTLSHFKREVLPDPAEQRSRLKLADSLTYKLQLTAQYFYADIWQSLTHEEKFLLYDLAEDGLINSFDSFNVTTLICKGLILNNDGVLVLFNFGFRNYILTAIGDKEIARIKEQIKDNGRWGNLKTPMTLVILSVLAFLFASQQEAYSKLIAYVSMLSASVPVVLKMFSFFGGNAGAQKVQ